jgi:hypothetical protein
VDQAERAVAVARPLLGGALHDHAHRGQVVDLVELATLLRHLVVDGVEVLRAPGDLDGDVDLVELELQDARSLGDVPLAVGAPLGDHRLDLLVLARVQRLEREVLEFPLEGVDAETVRERCVHLERLLCLLHLLLLAEVLDLAEVVQPVGELDQDHAHVLCHRDDQLAVVLGLGLLPALELHPGQLRHALDELCDLLAELGTDVLELDVRCPRPRRGGARRRSSRRPAEAARRSWPRPTGAARTPPRAALLPLVCLGCEAEGSADQLAVDVRVVCRHVRDQLVDELLMLF